MRVDARMLAVLTAGAVTMHLNAGCAQTHGGPQPPAADPWYAQGQAELKKRLAQQRIDKPAKNVILFVGDGMDPTTVTAARIYAGQKLGKSGEEHVLSFESFPHLAMSKTYNTDAQTPDSAGTMSAMVTGVKTRQGVLSIGQEARRGDCDAGLAASVATIGELAEMAGMATGVVSTARITHATPAAVYAHAADRGWEVNAALPDGSKCKDIAAQLIDFPYGDGIDVALGGGRAVFMTTEATDPEDESAKGRRTDGRDLTAEWQAKSPAHRYVWNQAQFEALRPGQKALGLFENSHMKYEADRARDPGGEPSLAEMTGKSIDMLSQDEDGFFLMVEGARIDHAHHGGNAYRALEDTLAYAEAVSVAMAKTNEEDTLIIVTADHGHVITLQGYAGRGNPILGLSYDQQGEEGGKSPRLATDSKPYTTITYANGPGSVFSAEGARERESLTDEQVADPNYVQQALIPMGSETHGGQDVTIYAHGPKAFLIDGTVEQNYIFHVMEHALGLKERVKKR